ncbi:P-type DNA transfer protein VirB5 [Caballeronia sp. SBC2]|uniref:P-type DNA transfer protein VirB5 n=1 Tax=Caballeronia sp. SBC2 TaxID=2705547 RepID=UPI0013E14094|nr:P-type DNA transfer protein VirB5 [Caballeronia sp. SBC2]QIE30255.1 Type IV secretion system protein virB5 [Caballeronia sp. SBC2]
MMTHTAEQHRFSVSARARLIAFSVVALSIVMPAANTYAQGIPVISVAELAQDVVMAGQLEQQVQTMEQQYTTMTTQLNALTGNRGLGQILDNPSMHSYLPDQWQSIYGQVKGGQLSGISSAASQIESDEGMTATTPGQQRYNDTLAANKAMSMQAYQANLSRLQNIKSLMQQSDATQDPAAKADLQNRLQSENAMIQNEQTRLNLMGQLQQAEEKLAAQQAQQDTHNLINQ